MTTYWLLFGCLALMAASHMRPQLHDLKRQPIWKPAWIVAFISLTLLIGLRHHVGGDWAAYLKHVESLQSTPMADFWQHGDPAYAFLNWLGGNVWGGIYLVNMVSAVLFSWGLLAFCRSQPRPWLVLVIAVPYLVIVVAMGYTRQGVAIGLAMLGLVALFNGFLLRFLGWIALAALFHKSAVVLAPMALFSGNSRPLLTAAGVTITAALLFKLLLEESIDVLIAGYIEDEYQSAGAAVRVAMNGLPAIIFLLLRKRFALPKHIYRFWTWMAVSALGFVALLYLSPSSTAVDRVALYWIPLQLFVWGRLPDVLSKSSRRNPVWTIAVIGYSATILFVWLFYADNSFAWLPYRFYPLELVF